MVTLTDTATLQGLYQHVKFVTGQSNLAFEDFVRIINFAIDDYSSIALSCDGRWKFDGSTESDRPQGYSQSVASQRAYTLDTNFLKINRVEWKENGVWTVLKPIDQRDYKDEALEHVFAVAGVPEYYDYDGNQILLYPASNRSDSGDANVIANNSLHVDFSRPAPYFATTDTTATLPIPRVHHRYLALKAQHEVLMSTNDPSISKIEQELVSWEGTERQGRLTGGKIREFYTTRDENTPRRIKSSVHSAFQRSFNRLS